MKTFLEPLCVVSVLSLGVIGCGGEVQGNGVSATETRSLGAFDRVRVLQEVSSRIVVDPSASASSTEVKLVGDANLLPVIATGVEGNELVIDLIGDSRGLDSIVGVVIEARVPALHGADLEHGSTIEIVGLDANTFSLSAIGGSIADISGRTSSLDIEMAGGAVARLTRLEAQDAHIQIAGAAELDLCVKQRLEGDAAGNSSVQYTCNPHEVDVETSGGSSVHRF